MLKLKHPKRQALKRVADRVATWLTYDSRLAEFGEPIKNLADEALAVSKNEVRTKFHEMSRDDWANSESDESTTLKMRQVLELTAGRFSSTMTSSELTQVIRSDKKFQDALAETTRVIAEAVDNVIIGYELDKIDDLLEELETLNPLDLHTIESATGEYFELEPMTEDEMHDAFKALYEDMFIKNRSRDTVVDSLPDLISDSLRDTRVV